MSPHRPAHDFRRLKRQVSIGQVLEAYELHRQLSRRGQQLQGPCPLHGGDNPTAFRVRPDRGLWHCFSACGGGDAVELVRRIEGCGYADAAKKLAALALNCQPSSEPARPRGRPLSSQVPFRPFTMRIPLDPRLPFLQLEKRITVETARRYDAGRTCRSPFLRGTAAVRLHDLLGRPLGYCGRRLDPRDVARWGKWRFPRAFPKASTLFNAHRALAHGHAGIVVVECPWAVLRLAQAGIHGAVALLGTQLSSLQARWLHEAPAVLLLLDGDRAGRSAARRISSALRASVPVHVHELPDGREPEDLDDEDLRSIALHHLPFSLNQCEFGSEGAT